MKLIIEISESCLKKVLIIMLISGFAAIVSAQPEKKYIRQGNREYDKGNFSESEISYRKALDKNRQQPDAGFNTGDALYKQKKFEDAAKQFSENIIQNNDKSKKSAGYYNLGNSLLNAQKLKESIEAYKNSLMLEPDNFETKYNLAYAQDLLKKQEENKNNENQKDNQKDQKDKQQNNDKEKNDQKQDQKDGDKQDDQNKEQQQQPQQQSISKEDAERLLSSIENDEKKVQEKVKLAKAAKAKVKTVKNW